MFLARYQDPKQADALTKIQAELDETKIIMVLFNTSFTSRQTTIVQL